MLGYGHLKYRSAPLLEVTLISWLIALGEYFFQIPANRIGYGRFTGYQLKILQESITIVVFVVFAYFYLGEPLRWHYVASFLCIVAAVLFAFWGSGLAKQHVAEPAKVQRRSCTIAGVPFFSPP